MDLHLHEAIALISLDDEKGYLTLAGGHIHHAFSAAVIMDLMLEERIGIEDNKLKLYTNALTDSRALNKTLQLIQKRKKPRKVSDWIQLLAGAQKKLYKLTAAKLVREGILKHREKKILWLFTVDRYPMTDGRQERALRERLKALMLEDNTTPDRKERMLLALLLECDLYQSMLPDKQDRKQAKARLKELTKDSIMQEQLGQAIQEMQTAVFVATTVAVSS